MFEKFHGTQTETRKVIPLVGGAERGAKAGPAAPAAPRLPAEDPQLIRWLELKRSLHEALLDRLNLAVLEKVEEEELRREVSVAVRGHLSTTGETLNHEEFDRLVEELIYEILGFGPIEPLLADPTVNDILVNGYRDVFVERFGLLERVPIRFRDEKHLLRIIDKIVSRVGRRIDESQPYVDARLEDGSRVNAVIRPCAIDGPSISIRKFSATPLTMDQLVEKGTLTQGAVDLLRAMVESKMNVLISGGTGSGKTTMLNALSSYVGPRERIVTIEDAAELQLQQEHVVRLETRPPFPSGGGAVNQRDLVRNALRMRPDRIIVGEVRGAETFDMLQAMNTGHDGSMTTVHANTARDALGRVEQMVSMTGIDYPISAIRAQIASGLHFVIQLNRLSDGSRRVMSISEIIGQEGNVISMQDIFVFQRQGKTEDGRIAGRFVATGIRPRRFDDMVAAGAEIDPSAFLAR